MKTACDRHRESIALLALGELGGEEAAEVRRHLEDCPACRTLLESLERTEGRVRAGFEAAAPSLADPACPAASRPSAVAGRRRFLFAAAATGVAAAAAIAGLFLLGPGNALAELARAAQNSRRAPCVHMTGITGKLAGMEWWLSFPLDSYALRRRGHVEFMEIPKCLVTEYRPATRTVVVRNQLFGLIGEIGEGMKSPTDFLDAIEMIKEPGCVVTRGEEVIDGRRLIVFSAKGRWLGRRLDVRYGIDAGSGLVVWGEEDGIEGKSQLTFDYPAVKPRDIYDLGVPRDVRVVDRRTMGDASIELGRRSLAAARLFDTRYRALIYEGTLGADGRAWGLRLKVISMKGDRYREESYHRAWQDADGADKLWRFDGKDLGALEAWASVSRWDYLYVWDGKEGAAFSDDSVKHREIKRRDRPVPPQNLLAKEEIWNYRDLGRDLPPIEGRFGPLQGTEVIVPPLKGSDGKFGRPWRNRAFLNPARDYIVESQEWIVGDGDSTWLSDEDRAKIRSAPTDHHPLPGTTLTTVLEYGRTPAGRWYPRVKRIEKDDENGTGEKQVLVRIIHLDTAADLPDWLFDLDAALAGERRRVVDEKGREIKPAVRWPSGTAPARASGPAGRSR